MAGNNSISNSEDDAGWVGGFLQSRLAASDASVSDSFLERCRDEAVAAAGARALKKSAARVGFQPVPFGQYVNNLAYRAGVALDPILRFLHIPAKDGVEVLDAGELSTVRLAMWLDISVRQLVIHLRLAALARLGIPILKIARLRKEGEDAAATISDIETELDELEKHAAPHLIEASRDLSRRLAGMYQAQSNCDIDRSEAT